MGMDIGYGVIYGVNVFETLFEEKPEVVFYSSPRFNRFTGQPVEPRREIKHLYKLSMKVNGLGALGEFIEVDDIYKWANSLRKEMIVSYNNGVLFVGFKAFKGEEPYVSPQDSCTELDFDVWKASQNWRKKFPEVPGKVLMYIRVSV